MVSYSASPSNANALIDGENFADPYGLYGTLPNGMEAYGSGLDCWWGCKYDNGAIVPYSCDAHADSTITAHFVWHPAYTGEEPPKVAVVYQAAQAWSHPEDVYPDGQGEVNVPLDHVTEYPIYLAADPADPPIMIGRVQEGYRYSLKQDPGTSFDITCKPTAHLYEAGRVETPYGYGTAGVGVKYAAQVVPVTISLDGTTDDTTKDSDGNVTGKSTNILIGQGITASLSAQGTLSNYNWTIPGEIFAKFEVAFDASHGQVVSVAVDEKTKPQPHWHWKIPTQAQVTISVSADGLCCMNSSATRLFSNLFVWLL